VKFIWHLFIHRFVLHPLTHLFMLLHDLFILFHASFLLTYESTIKICHYVFHKKCHDNFLESCVEIYLRSLSSSFWQFWVCVNEVFCPPNTFAALCLCMVEGGPLKVWGGGKSQMMCGITCFRVMVILIARWLFACLSIQWHCSNFGWRKPQSLSKH